MFIAYAYPAAQLLGLEMEIPHVCTRVHTAAYLETCSVGHQPSGSHDSRGTLAPPAVQSKESRCGPASVVVPLTS